MFNSEMIVGLWFVPVVLFILIPLSMLCIYATIQLLRKITDRVGQVQKSVKETLNNSHVEGLQPRHAV